VELKEYAFQHDTKLFWKNTHAVGKCYKKKKAMELKFIGYGQPKQATVYFSGNN